MHNKFDVVIVGGGHAGAQAAIALRQLKYPGSIAIVTNENELPYERPPLSKDYLSKEKSFERLLIRPSQFWRERDIVILLQHEVVSIDPLAHQITSRGGAKLGYGYLIWATGGSPRMLKCKGSDLCGIHSIRNREDVDRIQSELGNTTEIAIVGAGYIGLEAAAVLRKLGKKVTVIEALGGVLSRVASKPVSDFFEKEHRSHGVDIRLGAQVDSFVGANGTVAGVQLATAEIIDASMVIVGIGIEPAVAPLLRAGAEGGNGIVVDAHCRTSLEHIYAIGDCALHKSRFANDAYIRLESVQNANDQATVAAKSIAGVDEIYCSVPWFWSNQFDIRLQSVGLSVGYDSHVVRGNPNDGSFSVIYARQGKVVALDCVNATKDYVQGRSLVLEGISFDSQRMSDTTVPLKESLLSGKS